MKQMRRFSMVFCAVAAMGLATGCPSSTDPTPIDPIEAEPTLVTNCVATASSQQATAPATYIVDGNLTTEWGVDTSIGTGWFIVDLREIKTIRKIVFYPSTALSGTVSFSIEGSNDASVWSSIRDTASCDVTADSTAKYYTLDGLSVQYRYIRITKISWQGWFAAWEFQAYAD